MSASNACQFWIRGASLGLSAVQIWSRRWQHAGCARHVEKSCTASCPLPIVNAAEQQISQLWKSRSLQVFSIEYIDQKQEKMHREHRSHVYLLFFLAHRFTITTWIACSIGCSIAINIQ